MATSQHLNPIFIGVTGAQGVGKTSFCSQLLDSLNANGLDEVEYLSGLGEKVRRDHIVGSESTAESIAAVYAEHLRRQGRAKSPLIILDRCAVDALAHVRVLNVSSPAMRDLYEEVSATMIRQLTLVIHLRCGPMFAKTSASHETPEFRAAIAREIPLIIDQYSRKSISIDASNRDAVRTAYAAIAECVNSLNR